MTHTKDDALRFLERAGSSGIQRGEVTVNDYRQAVAYIEQQDAKWKSQRNMVYQERKRRKAADLALERARLHIEQLDARLALAEKALEARVRYLQAIAEGLPEEAVFAAADEVEALSRWQEAKR